MAIRKRTLAITIISGIVLLFMSVCLWLSYNVRRQAEQCLQAIQHLRIGSSTQEEVRAAVSPWVHPGVYTMTGDPGNPQPMEFIVFENSGFHLLGLFHPTMLQISLYYDNKGILAKRSVRYVRGGQAWPGEPYLQVGTYESQEGSSGTTGNRDLPQRSDSSIRVQQDAHETMVLLAPAASEELHIRAYAYNLACFTAVTGCKNVYDVLPGIQEITKK